MTVFGTQRDFAHRFAEYRSTHIGIKHLNRMHPTRPKPDQPIALHVTTGGETAYDTVRCWLEVDGTETTFDLTPSTTDWNTLEWRYLRHWHGDIPPQAEGANVRYRIGGRVIGSNTSDTSGTWVFADNHARVRADATEFAFSVDSHRCPSWAQTAVVYQIFLDRFYPGDGVPWKNPRTLSGFFGGTLRGAIQKLDYIRSLGCTAVWLSPLFRSPSHHGYDATDYYTVAPRFGTNADLTEFIQQAHRRDIRVILDFVANHWSNEHPTFRAAQQDRESEYHDWYTWQRWPDEYTCFFGVKGMPQLNLRYKPASEHLLRCAAHWLRQGVDGYRLDYALGPPHSFWADFRRACKAVNPDAFLFGEVVTHAAGLASYIPHFDGCLDFLMADALRETFVQETATLSAFETFLSAHETYFPNDFARPAFLDNHDMTRILYLADGDTAKVRLAALVLFTLVGAPVVYNGTEVGISQRNPLGRFEEARLPMPWNSDGDDAGADTELLAYFRSLGRLRNRFPVLVSHGRRCLHLKVQHGTYAYLRSTEGDAAPVLIALNRSRHGQTITVPSSGLPATARDHLNGHRVTCSGDTLHISLPAQSGAFIA